MRLLELKYFYKEGYKGGMKRFGEEEEEVLKEEKMVRVVGLRTRVDGEKE